MDLDLFRGILDIPRDTVYACEWYGASRALSGASEFRGNFIISSGLPGSRVLSVLYILRARVWMARGRISYFSRMRRRKLARRRIIAPRRKTGLVGNEKRCTQRRARVTQISSVPGKRNVTVRNERGRRWHNHRRHRHLIIAYVLRLPLTATVFVSAARKSIVRG